MTVNTKKLDYAICKLERLRDYFSMLLDKDPNDEDVRSLLLDAEEGIDDIIHFRDYVLKEYEEKSR